MLRAYYYTNPGYCPHEARGIARYLLANGVKPVLVRVSTRHIQVYTVEREDAGEGILGLLRRYSQGRVEPVDPDTSVNHCTGSAPCLLERYRYHLAIEAYWQAHEDGEELWRLGVPQGQLLAAAAGVLAKAQEGVYAPVGEILWGTLPRIYNGQAGPGSHVDLACLEAAARQILSCTRPVGVENCITVPTPLVSYRRK